MKREGQREKWLKTGTRRIAVSGGDREQRCQHERKGPQGLRPMDQLH